MKQRAEDAAQWKTACLACVSSTPSKKNNEAKSICDGEHLNQEAKSENYKLEEYTVTSCF